MKALGHSMIERPLAGKLRTIGAWAAVTTTLVLWLSGCDSATEPAVGIAATVIVTATHDTLFSTGQTTPLLVEARDAAGRIVRNAPFAMTSSDPDIVRVDDQGLATATGPNGSAIITAFVGTASGSTLITVATGPVGGTVVAAEGRVTLEVPAGAVVNPVTISVDPVPTVPEPERVVGGTVYDFGPDGTQFDQPVRLTIRYDVDRIPGGLSEAELRLHQLIGDEWVEVNGSAVDESAGTVTVAVSHFSVFGVAASHPTAEAVNPNGTLIPHGDRIDSAQHAGTIQVGFVTWHVYQGLLSGPPANVPGAALHCKTLLQPNGNARCKGIPFLQMHVVFIGLASGHNWSDLRKILPGAVPAGARCRGQLVTNLDVAVLHHEWMHPFLISAGLPNSEADAQCWGWEVTKHFGRGYTDMDSALKWLLQNIGRFDPTFVQSASDAATPSGALDTSIDDARLYGRIIFPPSTALVRAEIPIFGVASGSDFERYTVEYGPGGSPSHWAVLASSDEPEDSARGMAGLYTSTDVSVPGNLATWDTGLRHYAYLPKYPKDHPVDLKGTYTVRLVVNGRDGLVVEDRVTVFVANVVTQAWGGEAKSSDGMVSLRVPEHGLTASYRLIGFEAVLEAPQLRLGQRRVGSVYVAREAGEPFTATADLSMQLPDVVDPLSRGLFIHGYDPEQGQWEALPTFRGTDGRVSTPISKLHAYYAILDDTTVAPAMHVDKRVANPVTPLPGPAVPFVVRQDFEDSIPWRTRGGATGAVLSLDRTDGGSALKLFDKEGAGSFAVTVLDRPFDAAMHSLVEFDYRIEAGVKTDFYVKVGGRWYRIGLTGEPHDLRYTRVNIASAGSIDGIIADGRWRTVRFDLWNKLRTQTRERIVEQIVMANWKVDGLMQLEFGRNLPGATYWIDNFTIARNERYGLAASAVILVDDFEGSGSRNALGEKPFVFTDSADSAIDASIEDDPALGGALTLRYDVGAHDRFAGYVSPLPDLDLRAFGMLAFEVAESPETREVRVGIRDRHGNEAKVRLGDFVIPTQGGRSTVAVPLVALGPAIDWSRVAHLSLSVAPPASSEGSVTLDHIRFVSDFDAVVVDRFDKHEAINLLGGNHAAFMTGEAVATAARVEEDGNGSLRIIYGGAIPWSHSGWRTDLRGLDCSRCGMLRLRVRGARGGERPNLYLDDGNHRWGVDLERYGEITTEWVDLEVPLEDLAQEGVDLTHLVAMEVVFEWEPMSGAIYFDDIAFGRRRGKLPLTVWDAAAVLARALASALR